MNVIEDTKRNLYHNKFKYKLRINNVEYSYYTKYAKDMVDMVRRAAQINRMPAMISISQTHLNVFEKLINWRNKYVKAWNKTDAIAHLTIDYYGRVTAFSSDLAVLQELSNIVTEHCERLLYKASAGPIRSDTLYFKEEPKYKFRTYFKAKILEADEKENLKKLIERSPQLVASRSLLNWFISPNRNNNFYKFSLKNYYYVEYDEPKYLTVLKLTHSDLVNKTFKLQKQPV